MPIDSYFNYIKSMGVMCGMWVERIVPKISVIMIKAQKEERGYNAFLVAK
jgi:hypothetical protein